MGMIGSPHPFRKVSGLQKSCDWSAGQGLRCGSYAMKCIFEPVPGGTLTTTVPLEAGASGAKSRNGVCVGCGRPTRDGGRNISLRRFAA
jgi:hypothetical protein